MSTKATGTGGGAASSEQVLAARPARHRNLTQTIAQQLLDLIGAHNAPELRLPPERVLAEQSAVSPVRLRRHCLPSRIGDGDLGANEVRQSGTGSRSDADPA